MKMKICISDGAMKLCDQPTENCNHCTPGRITVDHLSDIDLVNIAGCSPEHILTLQSIGHSLEDFRNRKNINKTNRDDLFDLINRLYSQLTSMQLDGCTLFFNLYFNYLQEHADQEYDLSTPEQKPAITMSVMSRSNEVAAAHEPGSQQ